MTNHKCNCTPCLCPVCNPRRSLCTAMLQQSLRATDARLTPDNVFSLQFARAARVAK